MTKVIVATLEELRKKGQYVDLIMIRGITSFDDFTKCEFVWDWSCHFLDHDCFVKFHSVLSGLYKFIYTPAGK